MGDIGEGEAADVTCPKLRPDFNISHHHPSLLKALWLQEGHSILVGILQVLNNPNDPPPHFSPCINDDVNVEEMLGWEFMLQRRQQRCDCLC